MFSMRCQRATFNSLIGGPPHCSCVTSGHHYVIVIGISDRPTKDNVRQLNVKPQASFKLAIYYSVDSNQVLALNWTSTSLWTFSWSDMSRATVLSAQGSIVLECHWISENLSWHVCSIYASPFFKSGRKLFQPGLSQRLQSAIKTSATREIFWLIMLKGCLVLQEFCWGSSTIDKLKCSENEFLAETMVAQFLTGKKGAQNFEFHAETLVQKN